MHRHRQLHLDRRRHQATASGRSRRGGRRRLQFAADGRRRVWRTFFSVGRATSTYSDNTVQLLLLLIVVDSHIQRIVLATEETTVTQQVSHRPIKRQSRLWSQRGTKVNGSHHGDNPLLRPTGIQIATKVMRLYKRWHRPISKRFIKPPYSIREQPRSTRNVVAYPRPAFSAKTRKNYAPTSFDQQVQVSQGHTFCTEIRKIEIPRSMVVEALNW